MKHLAHRFASTQGLTLLELLTTVSILAAAVPLVVQTARISLFGTRNGNSLVEIKSLVSKDLNWIRWYAKTWNCAAGSYCSAPNSGSSVLRYNSRTCSTLISEFLADAASQQRLAESPTRPYPIPSQDGSSQVLQVIANANITRTIQSRPTANGSSAKSLLISYNYSGEPAFQRMSSVLIEAGGWCQWSTG